MKKIILLFFVLSFTLMSTFAATPDFITNDSIANIQQRIESIGVKILNYNSIPNRAVFVFNVNKKQNARSRYKDRQIILYRGLYNRMASDDEIAVVLAHEISHSVDSYHGIMKGYFSWLPNHLAPKKYEYKADKRGVDYMVRAGYNPVAMIVMMSKVFPQTRYDWYSSHPLATRRMMEVYEYIYKKYPEYLVNNSYKDNPFYQNFLLTSQENREMFKNKTENKIKKSVKYK